MRPLCNHLSNSVSSKEIIAVRKAIIAVMSSISLSVEGSFPRFFCCLLNVLHLLPPILYHIRTYMSSVFQSKINIFVFSFDIKKRRPNASSGAFSLSNLLKSRYSPVFSPNQSTRLNSRTVASIAARSTSYPRLLSSVSTYCNLSSPLPAP